MTRGGLARAAGRARWRGRAGLRPRRQPPRGCRWAAPEGAVFEQPAAALDIVAKARARIVAQRRRGAVIDYGSAQSGFGDTLQAMRRHAFVDPLAEPGEADLTVHVDFARLAQAARARGRAPCMARSTQGDFLLALGLGERAQALCAQGDAGAGRRRSAPPSTA